MLKNPMFYFSMLGLFLIECLSIYIIVYSADYPPSIVETAKALLYLQLVGLFMTVLKQHTN